MKLVVVASGKLKERAYRELADDYVGRLARLAPTEIVEIAGKDFARRIPAASLVVALDPQGDEVTSAELARRIDAWTSRDKGIVTFLVGGPDGLPPEVACRATARLSLSRLTLPHRLARVVLLEQLYRAMTLLRNVPYSR